MSCRDIHWNNPSGLPEQLIAALLASLTDKQKSTICFDWEHTDPVLGLLRRRIENDWRITRPRIASSFYSPEQQAMLREIFLGLINRQWHERFDFVLQQDVQGFGTQQSAAIFHDKSLARVQLVMTCRHMTLRCNNDPDEPCAFGGPIFLGHEGEGKNALDPESNTFWYQAVAATEFFASLSQPQQKTAVLTKLPVEGEIQFASSEKPSGLPIGDLSSSKKEGFQQLLAKLVAPFRAVDQQRYWCCLEKQGGMETCRISYFREGGTLADVWRCWRIEGPSFLWYFRGTPHIHIWIHVAQDAAVHVNAANSQDLLEWRYGKRKSRPPVA